ncbi:MAG: hypothetical protein ACI8RD_002702 [Bacillariaceae sp.]|jgi:hypothetical protein
MIINGRKGGFVFSNTIELTYKYIKIIKYNNNCIESSHTLAISLVV